MSFILRQMVSEEGFPCAIASNDDRDNNLLGIYPKVQVLKMSFKRFQKEQRMTKKDSIARWIFPYRQLKET